MSRKKKLLFTTAFAVLLFLGMFLCTTYLWIQGRFENATLDIIIIHLTLPLTGVDMKYIYSAIMTVAVVILISILGALFFWRSLSHERAWGMKTSSVRALAMVFAVLLLTVGVVRIETKYHVYDYLFPDMAYYHYFEDNYRMPQVGEITARGDTHNLVVIILESMENAFGDRKYFDSELLPNIEEYRRRNYSFTGNMQCIGTEYSVASFFSTLLGVPYRVLLARRDIVNIFLGDTEKADMNFGRLARRNFRDRSLFGVLEQKGYEISMFRAADARFCGYDLFLKTSTEHGKMFDSVYFLKNKEDIGERANSWGVDDSYLYDKVRQYLSERKEEPPFAMFIQTVNTHSPGYNEKNMPVKYNDYRDSVWQADAMVKDFVEWIKEQPFAEKTTIVIMGDHLSSGIGSIIGKNTMPQYRERGIVLVIINPNGERTDIDTSRVFATWDIPATIFDALGFVLPEERFGLGTSLFSKQPNLLQRDGITKYSTMIEKRSRLYDEYYYW